mmetsp:Transcript_24447/g.61462  ORF Transcript_24447/g.61462 Transcript_24447/m.61462 type:complete len:250 (-) Transcript_24447:3819-4568(-)
MIWVFHLAIFFIRLNVVRFRFRRSENTLKVSGCACCRGGGPSCAPVTLGIIPMARGRIFVVDAQALFTRPSSFNLAACKKGCEVMVLVFVIAIEIPVHLLPVGASATSTPSSDVGPCSCCAPENASAPTSRSARSSRSETEPGGSAGAPSSPDHVALRRCVLPLVGKNRRRAEEKHLRGPLGAGFLASRTADKPLPHCVQPRNPLPLRQERMRFLVAFREGLEEHFREGNDFQLRHVPWPNQIHHRRNI